MHTDREIYPPRNAQRHRSVTLYAPTAANQAALTADQGAVSFAARMHLPLLRLRFKSLCHNRCTRVTAPSESDSKKKLELPPIAFLHRTRVAIGIRRRRHIQHGSRALHTKKRRSSAR